MPVPATTEGEGVAEEPRMIPVLPLGALAERMKMRGFEWRVLFYVIAEGPLPAYQVAKRLGLRYQHAKRAVKELRGWNILEVGEGGVAFQPDPTRWARSEVPAARPSITEPSNRSRAARPPVPYDDEEITVT